MDSFRWAKILFTYTHLTGLRTHWQKRLYIRSNASTFYLSNPMQESTSKEWKSEVRKKVRGQETQQWLQDAQTKSTLDVHVIHKRTITSETRLYDSRLSFDAQAGALRRLHFKRGFDDTVTASACRAFGANDETVAHIVLDCPSLQRTRPQDDGSHPRTALALAEALGFRMPTGQPQQPDETGRGEHADRPATKSNLISNGTHKPIVEAAKKKLEDLWKKARIRGH